MNKERNSKVSGGRKISRRDALKGLATVPVVGAVAYGAISKSHYEHKINRLISEELGMSPAEADYTLPPPGSREIRIGIIGFGIRGKQLVQALGFVHPSMIDDWRDAAATNENDTRYSDFMEQQALNVRITAVCDIFDTYGEMARVTAGNLNREGNGARIDEMPRRYLNYRDLIASPDVDAVIIAAPDHWHGPMTIEAARAGKHVYCEKPLTWTVGETYEVRKAVRESGIVFQLGHQGRQTSSYIKAREALQKNMLGKVTLVEVTTNRNDPNGAWVYPIHEDASPDTIDWKQFIGQAPWHDFSLERFFRWRCWWDYSTGLSGDLLTHEYDAINQIMQLGIPHSAMSTGGIYYFNDGRTVPDVLTTVFEFPDRNMSLLYSATLASQMSRGKRIMGHDGYMEIGDTITIYPDAMSTRYAERISEKVIEPGKPVYSYFPGKKSVDAVSSATERYFAERGLLYTYLGGKRIDTTHLHLREWLEAIRNGTQPGCDIDQGFQEAMTAHMGTLSYKHHKKIFWDGESEKIIV